MNTGIKVEIGFPNLDPWTKQPPLTALFINIFILIIAWKSLQLSPTLHFTELFSHYQLIFSFYVLSDTQLDYTSFGRKRLLNIPFVFISYIR